MRTREEQIADIAGKINNKSVWIPDVKAFAEHHIIEAERRAEQRVRAEIGRDSERLDWLGSQDVVIGEFDSPEWKEVLLARYQRSMPADLADIRDTIDVAREVG
ncbi:hypothetical protein [Acetobacter orientalis]|uniref:hypothetical protein n=1 Tax=Acetobacter orientalis TaxID=146474 RepID=UPI00241E93A3|nr:hypothetical protein [Acetobacter orientalis]